MGGPLEGWRVLDLTRSAAGPYLSKLCSPCPGAHEIQVFGELGYSPPELAALRAQAVIQAVRLR